MAGSAAADASTTESNNTSTDNRAQVPQNASQPQLHNPQPQLPHHALVSAAAREARTATNSPITSPATIGPSSGSRAAMSISSAQSASEGTTPAVPHSPFLRPAHSHKVRETHVANVDRDLVSGRKIINQYEVIEEIGRGNHGKVKLARNLQTQEYVAIKIIPRFSKSRRLGKITQNMGPQAKSKKEIAILKKIRHANVVALLEVIDDPELQKIYMILEHVECGEIHWREKGDATVCLLERLRIEKEIKGDDITPADEERFRLLHRRYEHRERQRLKAPQHPDDDDRPEQHSSIWHRDDNEPSERSFGFSLSPSHPGSRTSSAVPSRNQSWRSLGQAIGTHTATPSLPGGAEEDVETPGPSRSRGQSSAALEGTMYGAYDDASFTNDRSPSGIESIGSHLSLLDNIHDPYAEDFSYVPCLTFEQARNTFRDTLLGLEYLHFEGIVHRDIKPGNLLWTRDHSVKISDFGVSYFGRPMRDETVTADEGAVSESEARDFDDELELAKTVGTPAYFAPELCYTDADEELLKVSEQIDVWCLGVTLYSLIYARLPFLAEDEFQMFRKIAKDEVFIPNLRLKPIENRKTTRNVAHSHHGTKDVYRDEEELVYEEVDPNLRDLIRLMLIKNPIKRIRLRDVKRHPWLQQGIGNFIAWMDDTDPSRKASGRKIQVNDKELDEAVVPLTFLERASRSIKKTIDKFRNPRSDRGDSISRKRATSSAASSAGDTPGQYPSTPHPTDGRRGSLKGAGTDYFASSREHTPVDHHHPLTQSTVVSPDQSPAEYDSSRGNSVANSTTLSRQSSRPRLGDPAGSDEFRDPQRPPSAAAYLSGITRHRHSSTVTNGILAMHPGFYEARTQPATPLPHSESEELDTLRKSRELMSSAASIRARSADRGLIFSSKDKRAAASVAVSEMTAPGDTSHTGYLHRGVRQAASKQPPTPPAHTSEASSQSTASYGRHKSNPDFMDDRFRTVIQDEDYNQHKLIETPDAQTPPPRVYNSSTPESFARAQETMRRRQAADFEEANKRRSLAPINTHINPADVPCPRSPDDELAERRASVATTTTSEAPTRTGTFSTTASGAASNDNIGTPLTTPSLVTSPLFVARSNSAAAVKDAQRHADQMLACQSDPSLPALVSGASSVSADPEAEPFAHTLHNATGGTNALLSTTDSLTPPALAKAPEAGFPIEIQEQVLGEGNVVVPVRINDHTVTYVTKSASSAQQSVSDKTRASEAADDAGDEDSDSDDGIVMGKSKRFSKPRPSHTATSSESQASFLASPRRRDTTVSVTSTETAETVVPAPTGGNGAQQQ